MKWREQNLRASLRHVGRRSSTLALANEQAVVEKATRSMLTIVTKRGVRNLETALKALSTPFVATPRRSATGPGSGGRDGRTPSRERSVHSFLSDLSLPSTLDMTPEVVSSAEEVVLNARRKRAILVGIIVKFQAYCRMYLKRNRRHSLLQNCHDTSGRTGNDELKIRRVAAVVIQCWVRAFLARRRFTMIRLAVVTLQANRRRLFVRAAYHMLLTDISKAQAVSRGHLIRRCLSALISRRMKTYKKQIFLLWSRADTPLSYRSKFWPHLNSASFVRMAVAELELTRLWKELKIQPPNYSHNSANMQDEGLRLGALLGVSNNINWKTLEVRAAKLLHRMKI